jgi:hypothetical protein
MESQSLALHSSIITYPLTTTLFHHPRRNANGCGVGRNISGYDRSGPDYAPGPKLPPGHNRGANPD